VAVEEVGRGSEGDGPVQPRPASLHWTQREPERLQRGADHWSARMPERIPRGAQHWTARHPDQIPRGDDHWIRRMPERVARGERTGAYTHPERLPRGEAHGQAKLNNDAVREIRAAYAHGATQRQLAEAYDVTQPLIGYIVRREIWKHLE
jgi:hypothetical protein